jgi:dual specificity protein phosphatase 1B
MTNRARGFNRLGLESLCLDSVGFTSASSQSQQLSRSLEPVKPPLAQFCQIASSHFVAVERGMLDGTKTRKIIFNSISEVIGADGTIIESKLSENDEKSRLRGRGDREDALVLQRLRQGRDADDLDLVSEGLYVGSLYAAESLDTLKRYNISHVVRIINNTNRLARYDTIHYIDLHDCESANIARCFAPAFQFIRRARKMSGQVLVHCFMGVSRSVALVCGYLMRSNGWTSSQALEHVQRSRMDANPKFGFRQQLQELEWHLFFQNEQDAKRYTRRMLFRAFPPKDRQTLSLVVPIIAAFLH